MQRTTTLRPGAQRLKLLSLSLSLFLLMCCFSRPVAAQDPLLPPVTAPSCANSPTYNYTIGNPATVTNYVGNYTFPVGNYHVVGTLHFEGGTVTVQPGTNFYVDGAITTFKGKQRVSGYAFVLGSGAHFVAQEALFTGACNGNLTPPTVSLWQGIRFEYEQPDQSLQLKTCRVAYAEYGVYVPGASPTKLYATQYNIEDCRFEQNLYHIYDQGQRDDLHHAYLTGLGLYCTPSLLAPYKANPDDTWTLEALHLTPTVTGSNRGVDLSNIFIEGGIYGLVANRPGQGPLAFDGNLTISRAVRTGIWLEKLAALVNFPVHTLIGMNTGTINSRTYRTYWTQGPDPMYGLVGNGVSSPVTSAAYATLNIGGSSGAATDTTASKAQTGIFLNQAYSSFSNLTLRNLTFGLSLSDGAGDIAGNVFQGCWHGIRIRPNTGGYTASFNISCNNFQGSSAGTSSAILVEDQAVLNQQGAPNQPQGNKFDSYQNGDRSLMNRNAGNSFIYYRYQGSTDELASQVTDGILPAPNQTGFAVGTNSPVAIGSFCQTTKGVSTGAQARGALQTAYLQAIMDTLRRQAAPLARLRSYQAAIRQELLVQQSDTAALEAYVGTLAATNPDAFFGLGLDLLEQYRGAGRRLAAARLRPLLAARVGAHPVAAARLALYDVVGRVSALAPWPARQVAPADSAALRRVARTPGPAAEMAALWFNYLYPGVGLRPAVAPPAAGAHRAAETLSPATVRALYPNPTADRLHVEATATAHPQTVLLRLTDLLSGRVVLEKKLHADQQGHYQADLDVLALKPGQYAATLFADGMPATTQKVLINR
ncbi:T9SS type A sorting domain-containing protein [Hymenobacter monticola]|uniref:T9SS type A sorting domain-containing protein n=1 Tax=Hymenobacter monticola TaxID=1705399 RepID=A0ABY4B676_9BACT|nr:T9SS type A sorting domain-containing protein [Hymenobacter monticola]UOE34289.1 T9SS type A sorting domain-containing protein [Hymenobacter monticola]